MGYAKSKRIIKRHASGKRLRTHTQPQDLGMKAIGRSTHPSEHHKPIQISFEDGEAYIARKDIINIFTDGSKTEHGVGAAFCFLTNDIWAYQWSAKLNDNNTVFQAELICQTTIPLKYT
ncbi:hypothetical protein AVEN_199178-1 [Araneus ventricosus]|uniref:RNase H type-1 domain-containing protein n=1 Tax=Araneus ventricosus TaxID=182803 RepID=A0A4Y2V6Z1_ARAVE|nr:hypothetical protein AVEN_199178-1 [Araneus ventricosus]